MRQLAREGDHVDDLAHATNQRAVVVVLDLHHLAVRELLLRGLVARPQLGGQLEVPVLVDPALDDVEQHEVGQRNRHDDQRPRPAAANKQSESESQCAGRKASAPGRREDTVDRDEHGEDLRGEDGDEEDERRRLLVEGLLQTRREDDEVRAARHLQVHDRAQHTIVNCSKRET